MELRDIWKILVRRKWAILVSFGAFVLSILVLTLIIPPSYKATAKILVKPSNANISLLSVLKMQLPSTSVPSEYDTDTSIALSKPLVKKIIDQFELKDRWGKTLKEEKFTRSSFLNRIWPQPSVELEQYEESAVLEIEAVSTDPLEAADIANQVATRFIEKKKELISEEFTWIRQYVEEKIGVTRQEYYDRLDKMQAFMVEQRNLDFDTQLKTLLSKIAALVDSRETNAAKITENEKENRELERHMADMEPFRNDFRQFVENPRLAELKLMLNTALINLAQKKEDFLPTHPKYREVENEVRKVEEMIGKEAALALNQERYSNDPLYDSFTERYINNQINTVIASLKDEIYTGLIRKYQEELMTYPLIKTEHSKLSLELDIRNSLYKDLLSFLTKVELAESIEDNNYRVLEPAEPPQKPFFPNKKLNMILAVILGTLWALFVGFLVEYTDDKLRSIQDLKKFQGARLLGEIGRPPAFGGAGLIDPLSPTTPAVERFRVLKNNLYAASPNRSLQSLIVASRVKKEGKSHVAANLAIVFAMEGKKTLLIDANLRFPILHQRFDLKNREGLVDILQDPDRAPSFVVPSSVKNLDIIPAGSPADDPGGLFERDGFASAVSRVFDGYDRVVVDTAPITPVCDTLVMGRKLKIPFLWVTDPRKNTYDEMADSLTLLKESGIELIGMVGIK